jgi:exodeoxyribonuclease V beta subunit
MLMGFADLVFEHAGSAWVLDYKSNHLGAGDADYGAVAMEQAVLAHRYDVQAALYLLALQRLLRARQGSQAGGVAPPRPGTTGSPRPAGAIFLFLRGIGHDAAGCLTLRPPPALIDALDTMLSAAALPST